MHIYIYIYTPTYVCIYIYIEREREIHITIVLYYYAREPLPGSSTKGTIVLSLVNWKTSFQYFVFTNTYFALVAS